VNKLAPNFESLEIWVLENLPLRYVIWKLSGLNLFLKVSCVICHSVSYLATNKSGMKSKDIRGKMLRMLLSHFSSEEMEMPVSMGRYT